MQVSSIIVLEKVLWLTLNVGPTDMGPLRLFIFIRLCMAPRLWSGPHPQLWTHSCATTEVSGL